MLALRKYFNTIQPVRFQFIALACLAAACGPAIQGSTPTQTVIPATVAPAATATWPATAIPAATASPASVDVGPILDTYLQQTARNGNFAGAVLVAQNGRVILSKGYGLADQSQNLPNTPQTKFRLYSITKQ